MQYQNVINNLIPADDLHWDETENRYVSISAEETEEIVAACIASGMNELADVHKFVQWCGYVKVGQILMKNFVSGSLLVTGFDKDGMPYFCANRSNP